MAPTFPPPPPLPQKVRRFQRTPPAIFPPILGLFGLGLAWRLGAPAFGLPAALAEILLGLVTALFLFAAFAYGAKMAQRPGVWREDSRVLPGRTGLAALSMSVMLLAAVLVPYAPAVAGGLLVSGVAAHLALAIMVLSGLIRAADQSGPLTPALHLVFVGFIVAPAAAIPLGWGGWMPVLAWYSLVASLAVYARTLPPLLTGRVPAPLRPLHAIHLAPAGLIGSTALITEQTGLASTMLIWSSLLFVVLVIRLPWMMAAGFSGFWSAFTFPTAAFAAVWLTAYATGGGEAARIAGGLILVVATLIVPPIALRVMKLWADGTLAAKTNAAIA